MNAQDGTAFDGIFNSQISVSNIFDWDIGGTGWGLSVLSGFRKNKNSSGSDSDHSEAFSTFGAPGEPLFALSDRDRQVDMSQEFKIASPADKPFRVTLGGYIFKQKFWSQDYVFADPVARTGRVLLPLGGNFSQYATIENRAVFGMAAWDITSNLTLTAELRNAVENKALIDRSSPSATTAYIFAAGVSQARLAQFGCTNALIARAPTPGCRTYSTGKFKGTDPRITINYKTDSGLLLYANYATGRKPGGFNGTAGILAQPLLGRDASTYEPEKSEGFEVGVKFDALDNRIRGSIAAFRNNLSNVQLSTAIPGTTGALTSIVTTTANARTQGFEIDLQAAPATGLNMSLGLSYVDAKFKSGCDADLFIYQSGGLRPNFDTANPSAAGLALCDLTGKRLPLGSPWTANGSVSYETEVGGSPKGFGNVNFSYESSKYIQTDNLAETGSTFLVNARIGVKTGNFTLALFGRNLTNEDSIPLATRWFDLRYGSSAGLIPPGLTFDGRPAFAETGSPRGLFGALRKSRTFGLEGTLSF